LQELVDKYAGAYDVDFVLPPSPESVMSDESYLSDGEFECRLSFYNKNMVLSMQAVNNFLLNL